MPRKSPPPPWRIFHPDDDYAYQLHAYLLDEAAMRNAGCDPWDSVRFIERGRFGEARAYLRSPRAEIRFTFLVSFRLFFNSPAIPKRKLIAVPPLEAILKFEYRRMAPR